MSVHKVTMNVDVRSMSVKKVTMHVDVRMEKTRRLKQEK